MHRFDFVMNLNAAFQRTTVSIIVTFTFITPDNRTNGIRQNKLYARKLHPSKLPLALSDFVSKDFVQICPTVMDLGCATAMYLSVPHGA